MSKRYIASKPIDGALSRDTAGSHSAGSKHYRTCYYSVIMEPLDTDEKKKFEKKKNAEPNQLASGANTAPVKQKKPDFIDLTGDVEMAEPEKLKPAVPDAKSVIISSSPTVYSLSTSAAYNLKANQLASGATTASVKPKEPSIPIEIIDLSDEEMVEPAVPDAKSVIISSSPAVCSLSTSTARASNLGLWTENNLWTHTFRYLAPVVRPKTQSTDASVTSESSIKLKRSLSTKGDRKKKRLATQLQPKHGLQSFGKVGTRCRMPPPANLPSLKSENSGNNLNISLVPSGGSGWGSATKEKAKSTTEETNGGQQPSPQSQPASSLSQTTPKTRTTNTVSTFGTKKTRSSVTSIQEDGGQERNFMGQQLSFFPHEFPKLPGGDAPTEGNQKSSADTQYGPGPSLRPQNEQESGNAASSSEAVTSTTNANSLSSEPLNFESVPSHVDIFSNNPGLEGCLRQLSEGALNAMISLFGFEKISRKEYPNKSLDIQRNVKDNSGFKFSSSLQNSQTNESAPEPEKKNSFISNPLHLEESSKEKLTEAVITSSSSNVPNSPVTACFGFTTKPIESKDTRENKPSVFKLTSESPSLSAFKSPVNLFKFGGEKADSTKNSLSSSSMTLATTTTTASFGFSSSGSTFYTDPWYKCTWFGTTEVTSTTAISNPVTSATISTAVTTSSPFVFGSSITSSTPLAVPFLPNSSAPSSSEAATTTSAFNFGASSSQSVGILNGDHFSTPNLPLLGDPESDIHLLNSILREIDSLTVNNKADDGTFQDCEAVLGEGANIIPGEAREGVPLLSDPEDWEAFEPALSPILQCSSSEILDDFGSGDKLDFQ